MMQVGYISLFCWTEDRRRKTETCLPAKAGWVYLTSTHLLLVEIYY